jgi:hypothetical protein
MKPAIGFIEVARLYLDVPHQLPLGVLDVKIDLYYTFTRCFVWMWNLVSHPKGRTWIECVSKRSVEENIWT